MVRQMVILKLMVKQKPIRVKSQDPNTTMIIFHLVQVIRKLQKQLNIQEEDRNTKT